MTKDINKYKCVIGLTDKDIVCTYSHCKRCHKAYLKALKELRDRRN